MSPPIANGSSRIVRLLDAGVPNVGLAPMEGVTTLPTRLWFWLVSAPETIGTPFLRVTDTYPAHRLPEDFAPELFELRSYTPYQLIPQMMAVSADDFLRAAHLYDGAAPVIEINCGCPFSKCVGRGGGSSLLADPEYFHSMLTRIADALGPGRFAVKMRTGFHDDSNFETLLGGLKRLPLARLTVHGRTRPDAYRGSARWDLIRQSAQRCVAPVIGSGDIVGGESLKTKCAVAPNIKGILIGRGALRNPWIFNEIRCGAPVEVTLKTLELVLASYALLQEIHRRDEETKASAPQAERRLFALIKDGFLYPNTDLSEEERWQKVYEQLTRILGFSGGQVPFSDIALPRQTMGRLKLIWSYMRSGLPDEFFAPELLRCSDLGAFLQGMAAIGRNQSLRLRHNPGLDWLYAGERRSGPGPI